MVSPWRAPSGNTEMTCGPKSGRLVSAQTPTVTPTRKQSTTPTVLIVRLGSCLPASETTPYLLYFTEKTALLASGGLDDFTLLMQLRALAAAHAFNQARSAAVSTCRPAPRRHSQNATTPAASVKTPKEMNPHPDVTKM